MPQFDPFSSGNIFNQQSGGQQQQGQPAPANNMPQGFPQNPAQQRQQEQQERSNNMGGFLDTEIDGSEFELDNEGLSFLDNLTGPANNGDEGEGNPKPNNQQQEQEKFESLFNSTLDDWSNIGGQQNFMTEVPDEVMQGIQNGDSRPFAEFMNKAMQSVFARATFMASRVAGQGVDAHIDNFSKTKLQEMLRDSHFDNYVNENSDALTKHPAFKSTVDNMRRELRGKFPNASAADIEKVVRQRLRGMAQAIGGGSKGSRDSQKQQEQAHVSNLDQFFGDNR